MKSGTRLLNFRKCHKKGFMAVETAIFLPIFLIGLLMLVYLIKIMWIEERVFFLFEQDARRVSRAAYIKSGNETASNISGGTFEVILKGKLYSENPKDIEKVNFREYKYLVQYKGLSGIIIAKLEYNLNINLPLAIYDKVPIEDGLMFRGFIGADVPYEVMAFAEMKEEKTFMPVWVFPRAGQRYHKEACSYITNQPRQLMLTASLKNKYSPCRLCKPENSRQGSVVYCFVKTGEAYHRGSCYSVDKYVIEMEKEDAEAKGYSPCMKCGGV